MKKSVVVNAPKTASKLLDQNYYFFKFNNNFDIVDSSCSQIRNAKKDEVAKEIHDIVDLYVRGNANVYPVIQKITNFSNNLNNIYLDFLMDSVSFTSNDEAWNFFEDLYNATFKESGHYKIIICFTININNIYEKVKMVNIINEYERESKFFNNLDLRFRIVRNGNFDIDSFFSRINITAIVKTVDSSSKFQKNYEIYFGNGNVIPVSVYVPYKTDNLEKENIDLSSFPTEDYFDLFSVSRQCLFNNSALDDTKKIGILYFTEENFSNL